MNFDNNAIAEERNPDMERLSRSYLKHRTLGTVYAIEADYEGVILAALDVTAEVKGGGLCPHMLASLPLAGTVEDVRAVQHERDDYDDFEPDCRNVHHLMTDLLALEREHRLALTAYAMADSRAKSLKKDAENKAAGVHELLERIGDRQPLPLFAAAGLDA